MTGDTSLLPAGTTGRGRMGRGSDDGSRVRQDSFRTHPLTPGGTSGLMVGRGFEFRGSWGSVSTSVNGFRDPCDGDEVDPGPEDRGPSWDGTRGTVSPSFLSSPGPVTPAPPNSPRSRTSRTGLTPPVTEGGTRLS